MLTSTQLTLTDSQQHNRSERERLHVRAACAYVRVPAWILFSFSNQERRCFHNKSLDGGLAALHMVSHSPKICHLFDTLQVMTLTPSHLRCFVRAEPRGLGVANWLEPQIYLLCPISCEVSLRFTRPCCHNVCVTSVITCGSVFCPKAFSPFFFLLFYFFTFLHHRTLFQPKFTFGLFI